MNLASASLLTLSLALAACSGDESRQDELGPLAGGAQPSLTGAPAPSGAAPDCSVVLYGDSILNGAYADHGRFRRHARNPAAELKARRPAWRIDDRTTPGQSLATLAKTFRTDARAARVVVIGSGIAEGWAGETVMRNLPWMVQTVRYEGRIPVLTGYSRQLPNAFMTPDKMAGRDRVDDEVDDLADDLNVAFADIGAAAPVALYDDVHPTAEYSLRLSDKLIATLDQVAPECSH
ncbi:hypothetical protein AB4Z46_14030 [Variovorax sp. M-6]|uniref:hypothetical protein n=1 Tax=Variovorax sp. M-6 TaxID=3233041 RepID=UPI003F9537F7